MMAPRALAPAAEELARSLLRGERWLHTRGVAMRAAALATRLGLDGDVLEAAAWLHDIGYARVVVVSGFHPLDGARFLARRGWPDEIVGMVAQHSGARFVAAERGLADELAAYPDDVGLLSDALTYADQTVGPTGSPVTLAQRRAEMLRRHGPASENARADLSRSAYLREVAARVEQRMNLADRRRRTTATGAVVRRRKTVAPPPCHMS
jgi:putative nucleotidyltransferase with HDIG domain